MKTKNNQTETEAWSCWT